MLLQALAFWYLHQIKLLLSFAPHRNSQAWPDRERLRTGQQQGWRNQDSPQRYRLGARTSKAGIWHPRFAGANGTAILGPGKRACKIASGSLWPGFTSANQVSVWSASPQLLIHDHLPFASSVNLKDRVQNSCSWCSQVKSSNQIMSNQGNMGHTQGYHNQASRIFNMIG